MLHYLSKASVLLGTLFLLCVQEKFRSA